MNKFFCALLLCAFSMASQAALLRVVATGTFSDFDDPGGVMPFAMPAPGTVFTMSFIYDDEATDFVAGDPSAGIYLGAVLPTNQHFSLSSGGFSAVGGGASIIIFDDAPSPGGGPGFADGWQHWATVDTTIGPVFETSESFGLAFFSFADSGPITPLTSDALVQPFLSGGWDTAHIRYRILEIPIAGGDATQIAFAQASLDSITVTPVPVPAAFWLFSSGLGLLGWLRRRSVS